MKSIQIDRSKMLKDQPHTGHNRWHPDVEPKVEAEPGEEVVLETRDACDGQILFGDSVEAVSRIARGVVHPSYRSGLRKGRGTRRPAGD